jgi:hypothetical protein
MTTSIKFVESYSGGGDLLRDLKKAIGSKRVGVISGTIAIKDSNKWDNKTGKHFTHTFYEEDKTWSSELDLLADVLDCLEDRYDYSKEYWIDQYVTIDVEIIFYE